MVSMKKVFVLLALSSVLLASCGGGGSTGGNGGNNGGNTEEVKSTDVLAVPVVTSASSSDPNEIIIDWKPSQSSETLDESTLYTVHVNKGKGDFTPSSSTEYEADIKNTQSSTTGLEKETDYSIKVVAKKALDTSISESISAKTEAKKGVTVHYKKI